jgi:hypothetical protein
MQVQPVQTVQKSSEDARYLPFDESTERTCSRSQQYEHDQRRRSF